MKTTKTVQVLTHELILFTQQLSFLQKWLNNIPDHCLRLFLKGKWNLFLFFVMFHDGFDTSQFIPILLILANKKNDATLCQIKYWWSVPTMPHSLYQRFPLKSTHSNGPFYTSMDKCIPCIQGKIKVAYTPFIRHCHRHRLTFI